MFVLLNQQQQTTVNPNLSHAYSTATFLFGIVCQCFAKYATHYIQDSRVEMVSLVCSSRGTAEACLKCEAVYQVELSPHDDSGCGLSGLLHLKAAVLVAEVLIVLRVYPTKDYHLRRFLTEGRLAPLACRQSWSSYCRT